ncbi:o-succinylbenzoate--CoA ligase [Bacillus canaveralius]|uniref:O-succinylbenzoate--CoA ligase n=1 Tax=Bacillus canaveralius TaxID=1403243 RepID=A0A2N5GS40_9BACI|nr:o-succinylbenzoate--CoA ligase [Bacillus canaveralius]PLR86367.1 o-succinylbenzoate--CoA ligase [Bacillus canaveralius]PLR98600.1 o-succinylbenzoate--CoA ligase [Bacillus canaveralius]
MQGIAYWIEKHASIHPDRIAIITEQEKITYKELDEKICKAAAYLFRRLGVKRGDRIAILSQNRLEYVVLLFAIAKIECIAVPLNIRLNMNELVFQLKDSESTVLFAEEAFQQMAKSLETESGIEQVVALETLTHLEEPLNRLSYEINENASFIICYTSGTTGKPKGAVLTQKNMFWNAINNILAIDLNSKDRSIVLLPLFHIGGIGLFALPTLFTGGTIVIPGKFEPAKALSMIEEHQATVVMGVPAIHQALLKCPSFQAKNLQSVRWFYNGGAPCPPELIKAFVDKGFLFGQGFGMTETSPTVFMLSEEDANRKIGSIGKPVLYCDYMLVDRQGNEVGTGEVGELIVRGPNVMKEYWKRPEATNDAIRDGWLYTGDLARADDEGFLYIVGRRKEMIISGGENIYPLEVEQAIGQLSEVQEVAVVGVADSIWGEVPAAYVVKTEGSLLTQDDIIDHCHSLLAKYKVPKQVVFLDELPKNSTGKIQKNRLVTN